MSVMDEERRLLLTSGVIVFTLGPAKPRRHREQGETEITAENFNLHSSDSWQEFLSIFLSRYCGRSNVQELSVNLPDVEIGPHTLLGKHPPRPAPKLGISAKKCTE